MNLMIIQPDELDGRGCAQVSGARATHAREVLRAQPGDSIRIGLLNGPKGEGRVRLITDDVLEMDCAFDTAPPPRSRVDLLLAMPRPKVMKRLWAQLAALGVDRIFITNAARIERNYFDTHVLNPAFFTPLLIEGLQQAQDTRLPRVSIHRRLKPLIEDQLSTLSDATERIVLHPTAPRLMGENAASGRALLAIGPEGGWVPFELELFERHGFRAESMGPRTLRCDTACVVALALVHAGFDFAPPQRNSVLMAERFLHTGLVADPICKVHVTGWGHPESPSRYDAAYRALCTQGLIDLLEKIPCREALDRELELCHTADYIDLVQREVASGASTLSTGDAEICPHSLQAARYSVGGVLNAVDAIYAGRVKNAFCLVRPPGHHATPDRGMGFCLFNNAALAARYAQVEHDAKRVVIIDWDVHHGNGTQDIFYDEGSVFYFSVHQAPFYPGTGARHERGVGPGTGATLNVPLPAGSGRAEIFAAFTDELAPAMERFRPDFVVLSAGFDSRVDDPLGSFLLTDDDFADLTDWATALARTHAQGRLLSVLEGGYNLSGLASAVATHVRRLIEA